MTNIIFFNDYVKINPNNKILSLDKEEKIKITDNLITNSYTKGRGLVITYDLSHSGRKINNRIYSARGQRKGIDSLTNPFNKPILTHHDQHTDPIGRFIGGEYQDLTEYIMPHLKNDLAAYNQLRHAFDSDEPEYIYKSLSKYDLLKSNEWPGVGRMRVKANITDEDAIKKFLDGRYLTFSAGSSTNRHVCSICHSDWASDGPCEHRHGMDYDGETCVFICGDFNVHEGSVVNTPADNFSQVVSIERMTDSELPLNKKHVKDENAIQIILTDFEMDTDNDIQNKRGSSDESNTNEEANETKKDNQETKEVLDFDFEVKDEKTFKVPSGAKGNAQKVLDWKEKYGSEVKGMTAVGWSRARQLATKAEIGLSTVKRMAMFNRHRKNAEVDPQFKSEPWKDRGYVAWLGWGGTSGIDWAIKISEANNDSESDAERSSPAGKGAKTPAEPSERIKGSEKNAEGSASKSNSKLAVGSVLDSLKEKVSSHNEKYGDKEGKKVSLGMLKAVYRRGTGAFSSTHRPSMSRSGWGIARVNAFLKLVRSGSPSNPKYVQDNDLLPAGHPKKTSNKEKDFELDLIQENENDLNEEVTEPTEEQQNEHDNSFNNAEDDMSNENVINEDQLDIDWFTLDLALTALMGDKALSTEARNKLPTDVFCGPDKSFPVPDCDHVTSARRLIGQAKLSEDQKKKVLSCVSSKSKEMGCEKSKDENTLDSLQTKYDSAISRIAELEEKIKQMLELFYAKNDNENVKENNVNNDAEKSVNIDNNISVNNDIENNVKINENNIDLLNKNVENPSQHLEDNENVMTNLKPTVKLDTFEQKVYDRYFSIKDELGIEAAENYLFTQASYLPRGFHPENFKNN